MPDLMNASLTSQHRAALDAQLAAVLGRHRAEGSAVVRALFGDEVRFADLRVVDRAALEGTMARLGWAHHPWIAVQRALEALGSLGPHTPICDGCDLPAEGALAGQRCVACGAGVVRVPAVTWARLAWTTGQLVPVSETHDLVVRPGDRVPLDDDGLLRWTGAVPDVALVREAQAVGLPLAAFAAWALHGARLVQALEGVGALLTRPPGDVARSVRRAAGWYARSEEARCTQAQPAPTGPLLHGAGRTVQVLAPLGRGLTSDVLWVERTSALPQREVLYLARGDSARLDVAWAALEALAASRAQGAAWFCRVCPQPVARGALRDADGAQRAALSVLWKPGFQVTLRDAMAVHPAGVPGPVLVWIWKRCLELLTFVHNTGLVHGAIAPEHVLVHPRDHGATLVGWGSARQERGAGTVEDVAQLARAIGAAAGATPDLSVMSLPGPVADAVRELASASGSSADAWAARDRVAAASRAAYGPASYHPLPMPGWG